MILSVFEIAVLCNVISCFVIKQQRHVVCPLAKCNKYFFFGFWFVTVC